MRHLVWPYSVGASLPADWLDTKINLDTPACFEASNKLLAKIASAYCKPNGMLWIASGMEQRFLAPLPIRRIPGIGPKGEAELQRMGVKSVGDLARLPLEHLEEAFGKWGASLYRKARGISDSPVTSEIDDPRSISRETTFEVDSTDPLFLKSTLSYLTEKIAGQDPQQTKNKSR